MEAARRGLGGEEGRLRDRGGTRFGVLCGLEFPLVVSENVGATPDGLLEPRINGERVGEPTPLLSLRVGDRPPRLLLLSSRAMETLDTESSSSSSADPSTETSERLPPSSTNSPKLILTIASAAAAVPDRGRFSLSGGDLTDGAAVSPSPLRVCPPLFPRKELSAEFDT